MRSFIYHLLLCFCFLWCPTIMSRVTSHSLHRHLLHHYPYFPLDSSTTTTQPPSPPPQPSSELTSYPFTTSNPYPFFPSNPSPPPPSIASFPVNISSLIFPNSSHHHRNNNILVILIATSLSAFALLILLAFLLLIYRWCSRRRNVVVLHKPLRSEQSENAPSLTETTATTTTTTMTSDGSLKMIRPPILRNGRGIIGTSTEFLYLGTVGCNSSSEIGSPELRPLPPLPKFNPFTSGEQFVSTRRIEDVDEEFFSPRGSSSSGSRKLNDRRRTVNYKTASGPSSNSTSPTLSASDHTTAFMLRSPSLSSSSPEIELGRPRYPRTRLSRDEFVNVPPPSFSNSEAQQTLKPMLKPLHWAKSPVSSEKSMAWDDIKLSPFILKTETTDSMFMLNDKGCQNVSPSAIQDNLVLDSSMSSHSIAMLLWASNVTTNEVCDALLEGNADALGSQLLECLLKMAPSEKEEHNLKDVDGEKFLEMLLDIPYVFERMDVMLYMSRFDSEVEYVIQAYQTLQAACCELKESEMFLKLLGSVLNAGNGMNVGTNRENAPVFKLDTLLKLVDAKCADGKTSLLHFVVEETIKADLISALSPHEEVESRKCKLQAVTNLTVELSNVKKAAEINSNILSNEVDKLVNQLLKVKHILKLAKEFPFVEAITMFLKKAEIEISRIQVQQNTTFKLVKEVNEYFHGDDSKQEADPFRIFLVVRDFLVSLDLVGKEIWKRNLQIIMCPGNPPFNWMQQSFNNGDQRSFSMTYVD